MRTPIRLIASLCFSVVFKHWRVEADPFKYQLCDPTQQYLDISSLTCVNCNDDDDGSGSNNNKVPDLSVVDLLGNPLRCKCAQGYYNTPQACSVNVGRQMNWFTMEPV